MTTRAPAVQPKVHNMFFFVSHSNSIYFIKDGKEQVFRWGIILHETYQIRGTWYLNRNNLSRIERKKVHYVGSEAAHRVAAWAGRRLFRWPMVHLLPSSPQCGRDAWGLARLKQVLEEPSGFLNVQDVWRISCCFKGSWTSFTDITQKLFTLIGILPVLLHPYFGDSFIQFET